MKEKTKEEAIQEIKDVIYQLEQRIEKYEELLKLNNELLSKLENTSFEGIADSFILTAIMGQIAIVGMKPIRKKRFDNGGITIVGGSDKEEIQPKC